MEIPKSNVNYFLINFVPVLDNTKNMRDILKHRTDKLYRCILYTGVDFTLKENGKKNGFKRSSPRKSATLDGFTPTNSITGSSASGSSGDFIQGDSTRGKSTFPTLDSSTSRKMPTDTIFHVIFVKLLVS